MKRNAMFDVPWWGVNRWRWAGLCLAVVVLAAGCKSAPPPKGRAVDARIVASQDVNPDPLGVASPIGVRIVQLRSDARFEHVAFTTVFDDPQAALGPDFVAVQELVLRPGETRELALDLRPETEFIGVVAAFQALPEAQWKAWTRAPKRALVPGFRDGAIRISIERARVSFDDGKGS